LWTLQNAKKGDFARHRLKGKRAIELGAGMGLGGFAFALLGCDTTVTDTAEVISLLQRNYENNLSPAALRGENIVCLHKSCHYSRNLNIQSAAERLCHTSKTEGRAFATLCKGVVALQGKRCLTQLAM